MAKQSTFTLRLEPEKLAIFNAICALNHTTGSDVLRSFVDAYVEENKTLINIDEWKKRP